MEKKTDMKMVGITGGIGTGKSSVADIIEQSGFKVIRTDDIAKQLMVTDTKLKKKIILHFGVEVYFPDGSLNAALLSSLVFGDDEKNKENLRLLNSIVHPATIDTLIEQAEYLAGIGERLVFVESALIYEAGLDEGFDYIIVVDAPEDKILERIHHTGKMSAEQVRYRMVEQIPQSEKVQWADFVINNKDSKEDLQKSVGLILNIIKGLSLNEQ